MKPATQCSSVFLLWKTMLVVLSVLSPGRPRDLALIMGGLAGLSHGVNLFGVGRLIYGKEFAVELEDRTLAHVEAAIETKLRRGEPFMFTWKIDTAEGSGRTSVWVNRSSTLVFKYRQPRQQINGAWVNAMLSTANTLTGLYVVREPE